MLLVGLLVALAKACAALREVAVAWRYGISGTVDAFQLALTVTTWTATIVTAMSTVVLVPRLVALHRREQAHRAFVAELNGTVVLVAAAVGLLTWATAPQAISLISGGLDDQTRALATSMGLRMAPVASLTILAGYFAIRLQARERFGYSLIEALPAVTTGVLVLVVPSEYGGAPLIWGVLLGLVFQVLWLGWLTARSDGSIGSVRFRRQSDQWPAIYGSVMFMAAGQIVLAISAPVDQAFAASLGDGSVAALGYATRIVALFTTFGSVVVARAVLPVLSGAVADGQYELGRHQTLRWAWLMFALGVAAALLGWVLAPLGIGLLYERGAFGAGETLVVAEVFRYGLLQLPFFLGGLVLVQWNAALRRYQLLLWVSVSTLAAKILLSILLVEALGLVGLMLATSGMYALSSLLMLLFSKGTYEKIR